jgi:hypothetical protein
MQCSKRPPVAESVNHLIRPAQERYRKCYAKRSRNVEIENEHDVRRLLDGAAQTVFPGLPRDVLSAVGTVAGPRCLKSAAWSLTKSRMFIGASPVSLRMVSVMRS